MWKSSPELALCPIKYAQVCCPLVIHMLFLSEQSGTISTLNTLRPRQNGRHFADDTFKRIFMNENVKISINISLKFVPKGLINNIPALVQIMAWRRPGDKPLSEPMMVRLPTHICVARPQWVNRLVIVYSALFVVVIWSVHVDLWDACTHIFQNCFYCGPEGRQVLNYLTGTGAIMRLPQYQWGNCELAALLDLNILGMSTCNGVNDISIVHIVQALFCSVVSCVNLPVQLGFLYWYFDRQITIEATLINLVWSITQVY